MYPNSFATGHSRSRLYNEMLLSCPPLSRAPVTAPHTTNLTKPILSFTQQNLRKRPIGEEVSVETASSTKRSRTAPPLPPYDTLPNTLLRLRSLSPNKKFTDPLISPSHSPNTLPILSPPKIHMSHRRRQQVRLPPIASALSSAPITPRAPIKLKPITPTVSLDYFDTYKPNDEQWRCGILDSIKGDEKPFPNRDTSVLKPKFDLRILLKLTMLHPSTSHTPYVEARKINFPYELNYTYLNGLYLKDVENFPEWREAAQLLIQLSQPQQHPVVASSQPLSATSVGASLPLMYTLTGYTYTSTSQGHSQQNYHMYSTPLASAAPTPAMAPMATASQPIVATSMTPHINYASEVESKLHKFIPITPPTKTKPRVELTRLPPKHLLHRVCILCGLDQLPCWRPSWLIKEGQLCNLCGLRYKKTLARCLNVQCKKIPAKGEWLLMQGKGKVQFEDGIEGYSCLECGWRVEVKK